MIRASVVAAAVSLSVFGCAKTQVVDPIDGYGLNLGFDVRQQAGEFRDSYVLSRVEEQELMDFDDEAVLKGYLEHQFESSVATLFVGDLHHEEGLEQTLMLIRHAPQLFALKRFDKQLQHRSHALWDLSLTVRIQDALSGSKKAEPNLKAEHGF